MGLEPPSIERKTLNGNGSCGGGLPCECESVISRMEWALWVGGNFTKRFCGYLSPLALFCLQENREQKTLKP